MEKEFEEEVSQGEVECEMEKEFEEEVSQGEVECAIGKLHGALENVQRQTARLIARLNPVLNLNAFTKSAEEAPVPQICPLAMEIRRETFIARDVLASLNELLESIEL